MTVGYIGLGKMGKNMVLRMLENNIEVVAWNRSPEPLEEVAAAGAQKATDFAEMVTLLRNAARSNQTSSSSNAQTPQSGQSPTPITIWLMLPAGEVIDEILRDLVPHLQPGDMLIDGANSHYKDTLRRYTDLTSQQIKLVDVAVSGGPHGARSGACLFVGATDQEFVALEPLIKVLAAPGAYAHCGTVGSGHFAKMVHNGIEYGMMQAIAEGAAVLAASQFHFDLGKIFALYNNRSVIESRLVGWAQEALAENPTLADVSSTIAHSGEGAWTIEAAKELGIAVPIIEESLAVRMRSSKEPESFRNKVVTVLRGKFGGHNTKTQ